MANTTVHDGLWHHIAVSVRGTAVQFYRDALPDGSPSSNVPGSFTGARKIAAGSDASLVFVGKMNDIRIYNRWLTANEIASIYADPWAMYRLKRRRPMKAPAAAPVVFAPGLMTPEKGSGLPRYKVVAF
jgi:hypothetical protein